MGHLEAAVRILAMLARGGCSVFEERLQLLLQVGHVLRIPSKGFGAFNGTSTEIMSFGCLDFSH